MVNILKSYPAKYVYAGYSVRQGLSVMMTNMARLRMSQRPAAIRMDRGATAPRCG